MTNLTLPQVIERLDELAKNTKDLHDMHVFLTATDYIRGQKSAKIMEGLMIDELRDMIHEMLDANGHMANGIHSIMEEYQVSEERAKLIRSAAKEMVNDTRRTNRGAAV